MPEFLLDTTTAACGVLLVVGRKQFAARTVKQQNRIWRTAYGERALRHNERVAVVVGMGAILLAAVMWFT